MLGMDAEQVPTKAYMALGHDPSVEHVVFAEDGSAIAAMPSAYSLHQHSESSEGPLIRAAGWRAAPMAIVSSAAVRLFRFIDTVADGDYCLQAPRRRPAQPRCDSVTPTGGGVFRCAAGCGV